MRRKFFDLETDGLDPDVIHCISVGEQGKPVHSFGPDQIREGLWSLLDADELVAHNGLGYDFRVIKKLYPDWQFKGKRTDTLVLSRLIRADLKNEDWNYNWNNDILPKKLYGSHSLKAWGMRLQSRLGGDMLKGDYDGGWEHWSQDMQDYCDQDVRVTMALYEFLNVEDHSEESRQLAHEIAEIAEDIGKAGWTFDSNKAGKLYAELCRRREEIEHDLQNLFEPWVVEETFIPKRNNKTLGYIEGEPFIKKTTVEFNPSSRRHIEFCLAKKYGWKPSKTTPQGHAIIDEVVLGSLDYPEAQKLSEMFLISKRLGQLGEGSQAWMKKVDSDGKIRHRLLCPSTRTLRCTHIQPNLSQVPAVRLPYGKECRELFTVPDGWWLCGSDLSGIEVRCLAHYLYPYDKGEYAEQILEGDIHSYNQRAAGLATRDLAKRWLYSTLYGGGDALIGQIAGGGAQRGRELKANYDKAVPAFATLKKNLKTAYKRGFIKAIDGRKLKIRSEHRCLSQLLQSCGSIVSKQWVMMTYDEIKKQHGDDAYIVGWVHDEIQVACRTKEVAEHVGNISRRMAEASGVALGIKIPIAAEYSVGRTWADTH